MAHQVPTSGIDNHPGILLLDGQNILFLQKVRRSDRQATPFRPCERGLAVRHGQNGGMVKPHHTSQHAQMRHPERVIKPLLA